MRRRADVLSHLSVPLGQTQQDKTSSPSSLSPVSPASSAGGSRASSPDSSDGLASSDEGPRAAVLLSAGCQPDHVYADVLPSWRYGARRLLVASLRAETPVLARFQVRTDQYRYIRWQKSDKGALRPLTERHSQPFVA